MTESQSMDPSGKAATCAAAYTLRRVGQYPGLGRFLIGRVFYADAANTLIAFMGIYVSNEIGFASVAFTTRSAPNFRSHAST